MSDAASGGVTWRVGPSIGKCTSVQNSTGGVVCVTIDDPSVAPLIAAAPDLLEAAQSLIEAWCMPYSTNQLNQRMHALGTAVERAEGSGERVK